MFLKNTSKKSAGLGGVLSALLVAGAVSSAGAASAATTTTTIDEKASAFSYSGSWTDCGGCQPSGALSNSFKYAKKAGDSVTIKFTGTKIDVTGVKERPGGIARITLDGVDKGTVDLYAATSQFATIYSSPTLAQGAHTVTFTVTGQKNASSIDTSLVVDKAVVTSGTATTTPAPTPSTGTSHRIDVGSSKDVVLGSTTYTKDAYFKGGTVRTNSSKVTVPSNDTTYGSLYTTVRSGVTNYDLPVANGTYDVKLRFVEDYYSSVGARYFSVVAEGSNTLVKNIDIFKEAGGKNRGIIRTGTVTVTDGTLNLTFPGSKSLVAGLAVTPSSSTPTTPPTTPPPTTTPTTPPTTPPPTTTPVTGNASGHAWMSGSAGVGVANGEFAKWRGSALDIASTWSDNTFNAANFFQLQSGAEYGAWNKSIDVSVGAFDEGGSWAKAASGTYDAQWRASLQKLKSVRAGKAGTTYIRFAHEMNGYWFPWAVNGNNDEDFTKGWKRYRAIQKEVFPEAKLVFNVNRDTNVQDPGKPTVPSYDWRKSVPGYAEGNVPAFVDVMGVDYYNQYPYASTKAEFDSALNQTTFGGAPKGLQSHLDFARSVGVPLSVSEWSGNADNGDGAGYIEGMFSFFKTNAGTGAGKLLYEVQFNVNIDGKRWLLTDGTRMTRSAEAYTRLF